MTNSQIADIFAQIADILEFQGANAFRIRAYRNGSRTIRDLPQAVSSILEDPDQQLTDIPGIGKDLAEKCCTLVETGSLPMLDELRAQVPDSVLSILRVPGVGPKKAAQLFAQLKIKSLEELQAACEAGTVRELKGFGEKTERTILDGIQLAAQSSLRVLWSHADELVSELRDYLGHCPAIQQLEFAGSYRRRRETVGDLDILVNSRDSAAVMDYFGAFERVQSVIVRGDTKMSVRVDSGLQLDLRVVPAKSFGAALQYFTGSKEHNVALRGRAKAVGLKINEWGVFRVDGDGEHYVAGETEKEVYATLGLPCFEPELRENRREFDWAKQGSLPQLIQLSDIRGDLHMHTTATDGKASMEEMAAAAAERGLQYVAITDHSQRVSMAFGLDDARLLKQWEAVDALNTSLGGQIMILKGIECDILEKGGMDLEDKTLARADWVVAEHSLWSKPVSATNHRSDARCHSQPPCGCHRPSDGTVVVAAPSLCRGHGRCDASRRRKRHDVGTERTPQAT